MVIEVITYIFKMKKILESIVPNPQELGIGFALITLSKGDIYYDKNMNLYTVKKKELSSKTNTLTLIVE